MWNSTVATDCGSRGNNLQPKLEQSNHYIPINIETVNISRWQLVPYNYYSMNKFAHMGV